MKSKISMFAVVLACFGSLLVVSTGLIIAINFRTSVSIFSNMLAQSVIRSINGLELALNEHLEAASDQAEFIANAIRLGALPPDAPDRLADFAAGSLAAAPQIGGLLIANAEGRLLTLTRDKTGGVQRKWLEGAPNKVVETFDRNARHRKTPYWDPPFYSPAVAATMMNYHTPIWRGDTYLGYVAVGISTEALSHLATNLSDPPESGAKTRVFILYGEDRILAHEYLEQNPDAISADKPLLSIADVEDPVISRLKSRELAPEIVNTDGIELGKLDLKGTGYGIVTKPISGYGDTPLIIGAYFDGSRVAALMGSILRNIAIGVGVLVVGFGLAFWLSRMITRPIRQTSKVATAITALEFDGVEPLPRNRLRELDNLAVSFNAMLVALKSFGRYVPRNLVRQLIREGRVGAGIEERDLTVMFTDIANFTKTCETKSPAEVAEFVNHHLALVSDCIEQQGGTIDKFIGDAVMAFWGAPDSIDNQAQHALRAATVLQISLAKDNGERAQRNLPPVRIRIGIHSGPLIVGDIGSPTRINYTVIGDVVNITQRLEALGKEVDPDAESIVLVSRPVRDAVGSAVAFTDVGKKHVKGREGEIEVFRLCDAHANKVPDERPFSLSERRTPASQDRTVRSRVKPSDA